MEVNDSERIRPKGTNRLPLPAINLTRKNQLVNQSENGGRNWTTDPFLFTPQRISREICRDIKHVGGVPESRK